MAANGLGPSDSRAASRNGEPAKPSVPFSCVLIGSGTLPIQCGEILLSRGQSILGIITDDPALARWADDHRIAYAGAVDEIAAVTEGKPFDYLFSIVNQHILSHDILELPRRGAVNYHDGPLPRYAGTHATSWALIRGEKAHGVTWHLMDHRAGTGDILKQVALEISADETAVTLNARCYEAAFRSFDALVEDMCAGRLTSRPQDLAERTFFPRFMRPPGACVISWSASAASIDALVRGLDFGRYVNPLGCPKLVLEEGFVIPGAVEILDANSGLPAGTVVAIEPGGVRVATGTQDLILRRFMTGYGDELSVVEAASKYGLAAGCRLADIDDNTVRRIDECMQAVARSEAFWVRALSAQVPARIPTATVGAGDSGNAARRTCIAMRMPDEIPALLGQRFGQYLIDDVLLAAFSAYLARVGETREFDLGYSGSELSRLVSGTHGVLSDTIPIHVSVDLDGDLTALIETVSQQRRLAASHATYTSDIRARYPVLRMDACRGPIPVALQIVPSLSDCRRVSARELLLVFSADGCECEWIHDPEVLDSQAVTRTAEQFSRFLQDVLRNDLKLLREAALLIPEERRQLLEVWNETSRDYPLDQTVVELFEEQAALTPEAVAVVSEGLRLTYAELDARANRLAHHLRSLGVRPDVLVGVCMHRCPEIVVAMLAVLKAGGAYLPIDPDYPSERIAFMLEDSAALVVLTTQTALARLPQHHHAHAIALDGAHWQSLAETLSTSRPESTAGPGHLAYVIYTSGSTGHPKGVMIPHRGVCNFIVWFIERLGLCAADRLLQKTSMSFDPSVFEFFAPLSVGGTVVLASARGERDTGLLVEAIRRYRITVVQFVPSALRVLLQDPSIGACESLRYVVSGGEVLDWDLAHEFQRRLPAARHANFYGPTEASIAAASVDVAEVAPGLRAVPIGRPIANTRVYVLDAHHQLVPVGVAGELYIGGAGLARGYLNRPELTAERFVEDPFMPGECIYRTGDLVRWRFDGLLDFIGRADHQVKIRGFRIELGEIEAVLGACAGVGQAVADARADHTGTAVLVAYVVPQSGQSVSGAELRQALRQTLPEYMVPQYFVELEALPLTPNGKIDRKALPAPDAAAIGQAQAFVAPRTPTEIEVAAIFAEILQVERVGAHADFFELGGHSLLAIRLMSQLGAAFEVALPLQVLFEAPAVSDLTRRIEQAVAEARNAAAQYGPATTGPTNAAASPIARLPRRAGR